MNFGATRFASPIAIAASQLGENDVAFDSLIDAATSARQADDEHLTIWLLLPAACVALASGLPTLARKVLDHREQLANEREMAFGVFDRTLTSDLRKLFLSEIGPRDQDYETEYTAKQFLLNAVDELLLSKALE